MHCMTLFSLTDSATLKLIATDESFILNMFYYVCLDYNKVSSLLIPLKYITF